MLSSTNTILMYMAVCDFLTIVFPAPWYIYTYTLHGYTSMEWTSVSCFLFEFFLETTPQLFRTTSIWLTLALAVQRYIYVCHAPQARIICTISKTKTIIGFIIATSSLYMLPRLFDRVYSIGFGFPLSGISQGVCIVHFSHWLSFITEDLYFNIFYW